MTKDFLKSKYEKVKTDVLILHDVFQTQTLATDNLNFYFHYSAHRENTQRKEIEGIWQYIKFIFHIVFYAMFASFWGCLLCSVMLHLSIKGKTD